MRYTWWWLNGEELDLNYNKTGIYKLAHDYVKKYKVIDYKSESQDKLCIIIMKHKQKGLLELIIKGEIQKAIRNQGSGEWASLPHEGDNSRYLLKGRPQPATPMKDCMEHYNKFLKEELTGISNLHLKKGFLKEFDYDCCNDKNSNKSTTKEGYDIDKAVTYVESNAEPGSLGACALYVRKAINEGGIANLSGHAKDYYNTNKLIDAGFKKIGSDIESISLKKGDIAAFGAVDGHPYGHIAMYNGIQWISDFKQNSFWVATQYSVEKKYAIYRWE